MVEFTALLVAPFVGSFVGVLVKRLPAGRPVVLARSQCDACERTLSPVDLFPIVSWVVLRGACRHCGARLGFFYPGVEIAAFAIAGLSVLMLDGWAVAAGCALGWLLLALALIDIKHFLLPDRLTATVLCVGVVFALWLGPTAVFHSIIGAAAGFLSFAAVRQVYLKARSREGMGLGDVKLLGAGGAWLGWQALPYAVLISAGAALAVTAFRSRSLAQLSPEMRIPFGAYLAVGIWAAWVAKQWGFVGGGIN